MRCQLDGPIPCPWSRLCDLLWRRHELRAAL
jgi:hypothetical protein